MPTMFDAEIVPLHRPQPQRAQPQVIEQRRLMEKAGALTVRIQKLRALTTALTQERDEVVAKADAIAKG